MKMKADKQKQAVAIILSAMQKRTMAQTLWDEAEKEMAEGRAILDELVEEAAWAACDPEVGT